MKWDGTGPNVQLNILKGNKVVATTPARLVDLSRSPNSDSAYCSRRRWQQVPDRDPLRREEVRAGDRQRVRQHGRQRQQQVRLVTLREEKGGHVLPFFAIGKHARPKRARFIFPEPLVGR